MIIKRDSSEVQDEITEFRCKLRVLALESENGTRSGPFAPVMD